jgi:hypothetical protein
MPFEHQRALESLQATLGMKVSKKYTLAKYETYLKRAFHTLRTIHKFDYKYAKPLTKVRAKKRKQIVRMANKYLKQSKTVYKHLNARLKPLARKIRDRIKNETARHVMTDWITVFDYSV